MDWIQILKCPITGEDLQLMTHEEVDLLNCDIVNSSVWKGDGTLMEQSIEGALTSIGKLHIYPIFNEIIVLMADLALTKFPDQSKQVDFDEDKQLVQSFYDQKGWNVNEEGNYEDAVIYEDLRDVAKEYIKKCHDRVSRFLNPSGHYMLDAACGALQYDDYLQYSEGYKYRVCVDFSFQALCEAKKKLKEKGIYVLADMTNMPFKDNILDGFVSLNTIYHIPKSQQVQAINELYRLLAKDGKGIVVYDWFKHSPWMNVTMLPFRAFVFLKNRLLRVLGKTFGTGVPHKRLYFYAHNQEFFKANLPPFKVAVWRSLSVHFMRYYVHKWFFGRRFLSWVYQKEEKYPELCGLKGEYPMFVFEK